jgi:hypothetical protein
MGPVYKRGGLFSRIGGSVDVANIKWRGFRACGGASVDTQAGNPSYGSQTYGWDIYHKGIAISSSGETTGIVIEYCEFDNWRGECIWSGGGTELGSQDISNCVIRQCNASAISNGGGVTVDNCHIYDVYNGTECFALGYSDPLAQGQFLEVTNCVIEINRNLTGDLKIGKFASVFLGFTYCHFTFEDNIVGDTNQGGVFLSESASNVSIQRNTFTDTIGVYAISNGGYPDEPPEELNVYADWVIADNIVHAETKNIDSVINAVVTGDTWAITGNETQSTGVFDVGIFLVTFGGAAGTFSLADNLIGARPIQAFNGLRPLLTGNTVSNGWEEGEQFFSYDATAADPFDICPAWGDVQITDSAAPQHLLNLTFPERFPEGFAVRLRRTGNGSSFFGIEVVPDPAWNTLTRGYMLYAGAVLNLEMNATGEFDLVSYTPNTVNLRTLTQTATTGQPAATDIALMGQLSVTLAPTVAHTYSTFSGVAIGETITINVNGNVTISHVPGVMELSTGVNFVASGSGTLSATRDEDGVLQITIP